MARAGTKDERLSKTEDMLKADDVAQTLGLRPGIDEVEELYSRLAPRNHRRRYAQFFTPTDCAALMADWIAAISPETILDPAAGTGVLIRAVSQRLHRSHIFAYEMDPSIALVTKYVSEKIETNTEISVSDFLEADPNLRFDAVIANPPYLRHHDLKDATHKIARISKECGLKLSGLTNSYALFLLDCCRRLKPGGRLAFLIPTEWTNSNFGKPVKEYLIKNELLRTIIYTSHANTLFEDALTTASIVLCEKTPNPSQIVRTFFVPTGQALPCLSQITGEVPTEDYMVREFDSGELLKSAKWDDLIRRGQLDVPDGFVELRTFAKTKRGIATGANDFFHVSLDVAKSAGIRAHHLVPCIGKANDAMFLDFTKEDLIELSEKGRPTHLVNITGPASEAEVAYIRSGEDRDLHLRFLTKNRKPWYSQEKFTVAPIWAAVFGRDSMRFIVNRAEVANLTAFHGIYPNILDSDFVNALAATLNSGVVQSLMRAEMRVYGGGLNKVEPGDLLSVKIPDLTSCSRDTILRLSEIMTARRRSYFSDTDISTLDTLVLKAGREAAEAASVSASTKGHSKTHQDQLQLFP